MSKFPRWFVNELDGVPLAILQFNSDISAVYVGIPRVGDSAYTLERVLELGWRELSRDEVEGLSKTIQH